MATITGPFLFSAVISMVVLTILTHQENDVGIVCFFCMKMHGLLKKYVNTSCQL